MNLTVKAANRLEELSRIAASGNMTETRGRILNARIETIVKTAVDHPKEAMEMIDQTMQFYKEQRKAEQKRQPALRQ